MIVDNWIVNKMDIFYTLFTGT